MPEPLASAPFDLVLRAERVLVDGAWRAAAVAVRDGVVAAIGPVDAPFATTGVDDDRLLPPDQVLLPGMVDTHVHVNEPGRTEWEGFASATRAAAAGGVTTIVDMPLNSIPPTVTVEALDLKRAAAAAQSVVDVGFWGGVIPSNLGTGDLRALHEAGVFGFKAFLSPSGVDEFPHLSTAQLFEALRELTAFDGLLIVHAEDPGQLDAAAASLEITAGGAVYDDFVRSRPEAVEQTAIDHVIEALRETGGRAHVLHLSSASALPAIRAAKAEGLRLTVETCPHYLTFDAGSIGDGETQYKCCPPIRDEQNRELLWEALVDGTIDIVASDHSPSTAALKFAGDGSFDLAWGGIAGLEVSFRAVWTGARARGIALETVVGWMSSGTAALVGLSAVAASKGSITVGGAADLVAFAPETPFTVDASALRHRNPVSAFDGASLMGAVAGTWVAGAIVDSDAPPARLLRRG
ncbi:allantoinase AllB [Frigoribacterium sp. CFBP9039]|uniref:allantoinase AllB n=1 Tax=Frigoribacterium sp. CFBP9029 TaxID=3096541 RepID=UPI002A6B73FC|nr:allantoinase AllB [Frigoribacterium sp. CFBP9039]MDY0947033.1 allantoinase AllB [Frigoribacterium sp. CFBP9039]